MRKVTEWPFLAAATLAFACMTAFAPAHGQSDEEKSLEAVRKQIGALESRLATQNAERNRTAEALKKVELEAASARSALLQLEEQIAEQERRRKTLAQQMTAEEARLASERSALAEQVRLTYMNGRQEVLKLLLSQETPADFGRMMVYYDYFNRARSERIGVVAEGLESISRLAAEAEQVRLELVSLGDAQAGRVAELNRSREQRRALLTELEAAIASDGSEIDRLKDEEQRLAKLVTELGELLAAFPVNSEEPFPRLKGRLSWPVTGTLAGDFGKPRGAGVRWNGVLFTLPQGTPVRAVYHGRVAYADWLPGLGLLMVLDHGDGYMTLYGHNDALLKESGDWVTPGETIAEVGDSGGQSQPSLYFEIRHQGEPVNPHPWMAD